jgi:uncharacterized protein (DUF2141 family)
MTFGCPAAHAATLLRVRRLAPVVLALLLAPSAHAADLTLRPQDFSPALSRLAISASLTLPRPVGIRLVDRSGRRVGWIEVPTRRRALAVGWNGRIRGARVPDGRYVVQLVYRRRVLAAQPLRIDATPARLTNLRVGNGSSRFVGDGGLLTTVSPNGDRFRDVARVRFRLAEPATVTLEVSRTVKTPHPIFELTQRFRAGPQLMVWKPPSTLNPRTYLLRLFVQDRAGNRTTYGTENAFVGRTARAPVVRLQGIDAGFTEQGYLAGDVAKLRVATDAPEVTVRLFQSGPERDVVYADNQMAGVEVGVPPKTYAWNRWWRSRRRTLTIKVPPVPSGLYYAQLGAPDGRVGYAPFVVRPLQPGSASRILVVLPTHTWEAYNFQDVDGDGWGDTWYAGAPHQTVDLTRSYIARGAPPRFYRYDLPFLHWLYWSGKKAEFISDSDFQWIRSGDDLARAYDLVVFEGHEEYVTAHEYDVVQRFRDLGGNLMFLSANNFFWRVEKTGSVLRRAGQWRHNGRPEAALIGAQYRANDDGRRQGLFVVQGSAAVPWLWAGTGLADGATFGQPVGGYGIEIDARSPESPPETAVVATIPDLFGAGVSAEMTYYETVAGAKVFAAGALDFGGSATFWPMKQMLDNLWARLSAP